MQHIGLHISIYMCMCVSLYRTHFFISESIFEIVHFVNLNSRFISIFNCCWSNCLWLFRLSKENVNYDTIFTFIFTLKYWHFLLTSNKPFILCISVLKERQSSFFFNLVMNYSYCFIKLSRHIASNRKQYNSSLTKEGTKAHIFISKCGKNTLKIQERKEGCKLY